MPKAKSRKQRAKSSAKKLRVQKQNSKESLNNLVKVIRKWDDPILKKVCGPLEKEDDRSFIKTMKDTLLATKDGVGLAAPQIGVEKQVIVYRSGSSANKVETMINPIIVESGKLTNIHKEGCLSFPGFTADVKRPILVKVKWKDESGSDKTEEFTGFRSIVIQHEIDHLQGICRVGESFDMLSDKEKMLVRIGR